VSGFSAFHTLWLEVMFELLTLFHHRAVQDINIQLSYSSMADGKYPPHTHWGDTTSLIVCSRERRKAVRHAKRNPLGVGRVMTDRNIRFLCIYPGIGQHLLSFMDPKWFVGCAFDTSDWYIRPKLHVLPRLFTIRQKFFNIRVLLSEFCRTHVSFLAPKGDGKLKLLTSKYYASKFMSLRHEFEAIPYHPRTYGDAKRVPKWQRNFGGWNGECFDDIQFEEFLEVHDPTNTSYRIARGKKRWSLDPDYVNTHPTSYYVPRYHWLRDERWGTAADIEKFVIDRFPPELELERYDNITYVYDNITYVYRYDNM
jgi:hypothetical protein